MLDRTLVRTFIRVAVTTLLAATSIAVLAGPAAAAKAAPWHWKVVQGGGFTVEAGTEENITIYCPAGFRPVGMEYTQQFQAGYQLVVQAEYVDYTGNWGFLKVFNPTGVNRGVSAKLNCVDGNDIGAVTTVGAYQARNETSDRSGGYVDCPNGWRPFSFGAEWEGTDAGRRIDFNVPTEGGWYATGYDPEDAANLYLEVHCISSGVLNNATYVSAQTSGTLTQQVDLTVACPAGNRVLNGGGFTYHPGGSVDPLDGYTNGSTRQSTQLHANPGSYTITAQLPSAQPSPNYHLLVARAYCVPVSVPNLLIYTGPSGEQHSQTVAYSFTASDPAGEDLKYQCALDGAFGKPCVPGPTQNTIPGVPPGNHTLFIEARNESNVTDTEILSFLITTAPAAPTVTQTTATSTSASVTFSPGSNGASDVTAYTAECLSTNGGATASASGLTTVLSVPGLTSGKQYHCHVKATNAVGESSFSAFGDTVLAADGPGTPTITGSTTSPGAISVEFSPADGHGSDISSYAVECISTDAGATGSASGPSSPVQVTGLTPGHLYHCRAKATNAIGTGASSEFGPTVLVPTTPSAPVVTSQVPGLQTITVTFAPATANGSPVTGYTAECGSTDGGGTNTATRATSPITVSGLTSTKHYHCRVKATNAVGDSAFGEFGPLVVVPTLPGRPTVTKSQAKSPTKLKVTLHLVDDGGSPVSAYLVECKSTDGGKAGSVTSAKARASVSKLTPGRTYRCKARAQTAAGLGPWSRKGPKTTLPVPRLGRLHAHDRGPGGADRGLLW